MNKLLNVPFVKECKVIHEECNKARMWEYSTRGEVKTYLPCCECGKNNYKENDMKENERVFPSIEQDEAFVGAFEYLNEELFNGELPVPMLVLTRNPKIKAGHFAPDSWTNDDGGTEHEIALNANVYAGGNWMYAMQVLIHEMVHLEQWVNESYGRIGYHNKEFCARLKGLGVLPVDPDTKEEVTCGDRVADKTIEGGRAEEVLKEMPMEYVFPYLPKEFPDDGTKVIVVEKPNDTPAQEPTEPPKRGVKVKYSCAVCGNNVWGKGDMVMSCEGMGDRWHEPRRLIQVQV